ncbi:spindle assembly abnormal 4 isoform X1 [Osmia lignaria lignaria]|uniref:spindle assembly abnormal 4 isoform X1 n=2 Tax=Osmia lignaria lignaria TaxID=1437193 RepID=UPI00402BB8BC
MDLEATIVERLQKLRQWQSEQQKQLLKQQQIQREMLTQKQDSIYKALELSIQELDLNEDVLSTNNSNIDTDNKNIENQILQQESPIEELTENLVITDSHLKEHLKDKIMSNTKNDIKLIITSPEQEIQSGQVIIDGIAPLPSDKSVITHVCIDDLPIPSPKKDFHTLLEEKLKDCDNVLCEKVNTNPGKKVKKPFLKKGEGLSRFRLNLPTMKPRSRSVSVSNSMQSNSKPSKNESKSNNIAQSSRTTLSKNTHCTNSARKHLSLKNIPLPKQKLRCKSESNTSDIPLEKYINEVKNKIELNTSDFQCGAQEESEEVRIFELLEEKAENSSFCSTSSAVIAFLQQSTPFKIKKGKYKMDNDTVNGGQEISPLIKNCIEQSVLKSNQAYKYRMFNKNTDSYCDLIPFINKKIIQNNMQNTSENNKTGTVHDTENNNDSDVSLHVRFSEYNEYKTIELTDTSSISTESLVTGDFSDDKVWSDSSTLETSNIENLSEILEAPIITKSTIQDNNYKSKSEHYNIQEKVNCETNFHQSIFHKDESEFSNQSSDDEQSTLHNCSQNNSVLEEIDTSNDTEQSKRCMDQRDNRKKIDKYVDNYNGKEVIEVKGTKENLQETNETIFSSELLRSRLLELEQEINIFRKENAALSLQRKKLQEDHRNIHKEYTEKEKNFEENRIQIENRLQDERKKLAREKAALESRLRDSQEKAQQSKLERQEIQYLKEEIEKLREEIHVKESRWNAAQSRQKCQMRILKMENSKLKQEVERLQNLKKGNNKNKGRPGTFSNTRAIHQINKQLNMQLQESKKISDTSSDNSAGKSVESINKTENMIGAKNIEDNEYNSNNSKDVMNKKLQKDQTTMINIAKKRSLYENLIKEATSDMTDFHEQSRTSENLSQLKSDLNIKFKKLDTITNDEENNYEQFYKESNSAFNHSNSNDKIQSQVQNDYIHIISPTKACTENYNEEPKSGSSNESFNNAHAENTMLCSQDNANKQHIKQIERADGSIEYQFPNGNVKKVFPDQGLTRLIYYNGDIRETNKDGKIKYFYASTRTWHTTMPDGLEILEFSDGQVERRSHSGAVEVLFPDGSVRMLEVDGTERWTLPDGTLIRILTNGEKVLTLPNGQQEIHTKTHKRREYPDGTTKFIYPDGTQETRYSNGRIRLKDKDGNLLMDSYQ